MVNSTGISTCWGMGADRFGGETIRVERSGGGSFDQIRSVPSRVGVAGSGGMKSAVASSNHLIAEMEEGKAAGVPIGEIPVGLANKPDIPGFGRDCWNRPEPAGSRLLQELQILPTLRRVKTTGSEFLKGELGMLRGLLTSAILLLAVGCTKSSDRVVVYSAQDEEFAAGVFQDFESQSKLKIAPKYDTEANKSVSLAAELEAEAPLPRCDVHWNNEILGTIRLARKGIYEPYSSPNAKDFPAWSKSSDGTWQAFAERARVIIVNTDLVPEGQRPKSMFDLIDPKWKGRIAMAKPLFGTTATHAACLFEVLGVEPARQYYRQLKANEVAIVPGNKQVARGVAAGTYAFGITDSDDAIIEVLAGKPVAIVFPDATGHPAHPRLGTVYIPNTLAVVKGAPNADGAKKLIDYLLASEAKLATGGGYQFPLAPAILLTQHPALKSRHQVKAAEVDFEKAADLWDASQQFLKDEFAR